MTSTSNLKTREIIIRIDERQRQIITEIKSMNNKLDKKVDNSDFIPYVGKTDTLWDDRNKILGYILGSGLLGGGGAILLQNAVKAVFASL